MSCVGAREGDRDRAAVLGLGIYLGYLLLCPSGPAVYPGTYLPLECDVLGFDVNLSSSLCSSVINGGLLLVLCLLVLGLWDIPARHSLGEGAVWAPNSTTFELPAVAAVSAIFGFGMTCVL
ncbi:hypothetical protein B0H67DRAFT_578556 [Lasiosphaeris hirsuta]|uniref:Uncharacterized protein n=1 Tax=Lasiosphaeris hirsuta TaxID=260670 RepID=A0AA40AF08_9PEZI|nr:hypothetical protein B0H67DRAFT_578556 [Lasiosphaeris hirsuta]